MGFSSFGFRTSISGQGCDRQALRQSGCVRWFLRRQGRHGAGDLDYTVISTGGHPEAFEGAAQKFQCFAAERAVVLQFSGRDAGIAVERLSGKPLLLKLACFFYACADNSRAFFGAAAGQVVKLDRRDLDVQVDAVEQRTGDFGNVALDSIFRAGAGDAWVSAIAAGTGVHGSNEHHRAGIGDAGGGAGDGHTAVLDGLAQHLQ